MDPDGEFLHRVIERIEAERSRIEAEREATRETPKDREARLRVAFERGMAVWELDDGHFLPPEGCHAVGTIREELIEDDNDDDEDNENANRGNQRAVEDDRRRRDSRYGDEEEDANAPLRPRDDREGGGASEGHELVSADVTDNRGGEGEWAGARRRDGDGAVGRDENAADAPRGCYGSDFDGAADDCVGEAGDEENATTVGESTPVADIVPEQEYLYLNTRSNTGGSCDPDSSSARRSTVLKSKSMELKPPTTAAYAAPQDSHKIHNHCAICLCKYERGDFIVTSCNDGCPHAFHQECIVEWLARMQDGTPCPLCRRTFVELDAYNPDDGTAREVPGEAERQRRERRRRSIESGIQRGRVFDMSVINFG
ncbi:hypothetical protein ACHAW5_002763 [Stephanodiscus triporus]|uniref:RING-type domain-containing protein n=1 Tax=Stephanodiscus triporus TaxID=2934178 RepID=A0ABD3QA95_9STRA